MTHPTAPAAKPPTDPNSSASGQSEPSVTTVASTSSSESPQSQVARVWQPLVQVGSFPVALADFRMPMSLLNGEVGDAAQKFSCPEQKKKIKEHNITPAMLSMGIIPPGVDYETFTSLRSNFLGESAKSLLHLPPINILSRKSTLQDIQNFLVAFGVKESEVNKLPSHLLYSHYITGQLSPRVTDVDVRIVKGNLRKYVYVIDEFTEYHEQDIYKCMTAFLTSAGFDTLVKSNIPSDISPLPPKPQPIKAEDIINKVEGFKIPYRNYYGAIIGNLVKELCLRFNHDYTVLSPMVHLTNCSGTGKTRSAIELGNLTTVLYCKFGGDNGFKSSLVWKYIVDYFHTIVSPKKLMVLNSHLLMNMAIQRILYMCGFYYQNVDDRDSRCLFVDKVVSYYLFEDEDKPFTVDDIWTCLFAGSERLFEEKIIDGDTYRYDSEVRALDRYSYGKWEGLEMEEIVESNKKWLKVRKADLLKNADSTIREDLERLPQLLMVLDEAHHLMGVDDESPAQVDLKALKKVRNEIVEVEYTTDVYRILRGCLRNFSFYWVQSLTLTISTLAEASRFNPAPENDPSYRPEQHHNYQLHPPIVLHGTHDVFNPGPIDIKFTSDWRGFLFSHLRVLMIVTCGRPLWPIYYLSEIRDFVNQAGGWDAVSQSNFKLLTDSNFMLLYRKMSKKSQDLAKAKTSTCIEVDDDFMGSVLSLSVALERLPLTVTHEELVRVGGMTLFEFEGAHARGYFCPEGVFNGYASVCMMRNFGELMKLFRSWVVGTGMSIFSQGDIGKIVDRILMIRAVITAKRTKFVEKTGATISIHSEKSDCEKIFEPVGLEDFLLVYAGKTETEEYLSKHTDLRGSFVAFSHFVHMAVDRLIDGPYDVAANMLARGAALAPKEGTPGVDHFIPLVLSDGRLSFIYIQTKMGSSFSDLPSKSQIATSSPENRLFWWPLRKNCDRREKAPGHIDDIPPYCYIHRTFYDQGPFKFEVVPAGPIPLAKNEVDQDICHQPCLSLFGLQGRGGVGMSSLKDVVRFYCQSYNKNWMSRALSIKNTWMIPKETRRDFDRNNVYSLLRYDESMSAALLKKREQPLNIDLEAEALAKENEKHRNVKSSGSGNRGQRGRKRKP